MKDIVPEVKHCLKCGKEHTSPKSKYCCIGCARSRDNSAPEDRERRSKAKKIFDATPKGKELLKQWSAKGNQTMFEKGQARIRHEEDVEAEEELLGFYSSSDEEEYYTPGWDDVAF